MRFASKIGLSAALAALIIGPFLGTSVFSEVRSVLQERIVHEQLQMARSVMREIDTAMYRAYLDASVIAADELLREVMESPVDRFRKNMAEEEIKERERLTGSWEALTVFDVSGRAIFSPKPLGGSGHISAYPASQMAFQHALKGEIYYSDAFVCKQTGQTSVIFAAPVHGRANPGKVVGVVIGHYKWIFVQHILDQVDPTATVHLLNRTGSIIGKRSNDSHSGKYLPRPSLKAMEGEVGSYAITSQQIHGEGAALVVELEQRGEGATRAAAGDCCWNNLWTGSLRRSGKLRWIPRYGCSLRCCCWRDYTSFLGGVS